MYVDKDQAEELCHCYHCGNKTHFAFEGEKFFGLRHRLVYKFKCLKCNAKVYTEHEVTPDEYPSNSGVNNWDDNWDLGDFKI